MTIKEAVYTLDEEELYDFDMSYEEPTFSYDEDYAYDYQQEYEMPADTLEQQTHDTENETMYLHEQPLEEVEEMLPGAQIALVTYNPEEEERETTWEDDGDHSKFISYIRNMLSAIPPHSGQTTVGCEKAIYHLKRLDRELSKAIQTDDKDLINENEAEEVRDTIYDWIDKLEEARDALHSKKYKKNKKNAFFVGKEVVARINDGVDIQYFVSVGNGDEETLLKVNLAEPTPEQVQAFVKGEDLKKEAGAGIVLVEDPFLFSITRLLLNSHITQGKNMETVYADLKDKYKFTPREELSIHELLRQKGFPLIKDLGRMGEDEVRPSENKGVEYAGEYYA